MSIPDKIKKIRLSIPANVRLVCVSKMQSIEDIREAYACGERVFGESKVQELCEKQQNLAADIQWHFIGHLQTNKIKYIAPFVNLIHGVDSQKLLSAINTQAQKCKRKIPCLLQVHIAEEETKFGFSEEELLVLFQNSALNEYTNVIICGLMGMATFTDNQMQVRREFSSLKALFDRIKTEYFAEDENFSELSMGMSDDYNLAIEEGSTMVRVGSSIFGRRY